MNRRFLHWCNLIAIAVLLTACGGASAPSGGGTSSTPVPIELPALTGSLADVPRMTDPVVSAVSGSQNASPSVGKTVAGVTPYGIQLGSASSSDFPAGGAYMACGNMRDLRNTIGGIAMTDFALCALQKTVSTSLNTDEYYYQTVSGTPTPRYTEAKFKLSVGTDGVITGFELFACQNERQLYYVTQARSGSTLTAHNLHVSTGRGTGGAPRSDTDANLTATINSSNQYTAKSIDTAYFFADGNSTTQRFAETTYAQSSPTEYIHNTTGGSVIDGTTSSGLGFSTGALIDYNTSQSVADYNINLLGISDGAARAVNYDTNGTQTIDFTQGWQWDGTMMADDDASVYIPTVNSASLHDTITASDINIAFSSTQTWDCSIPSTTASDHLFTATFDDTADCFRYLEIVDGNNVDCESLGLTF